MTLSPITERFVLHWGEMGSRWGVNRTVAQIHALLFVLGKPMTAEDIADALGVARADADFSALGDQGADDVASDESLATQYQNFHIFLKFLEFLS